MKIFSAIGSRGPLNRSKAFNCLLVNQLATPGLGSLLGGRRVAGSLQLALSLAGFCGILGWFMQLFLDIYREMDGLPPAPKPYPWMGKIGLLLFAASWILSGITSLQLLREAARNEPDRPPVSFIPPRIK